jgi:hypothetical protein
MDPPRSTDISNASTDTVGKNQLSDRIKKSKQAIRNLEKRAHYGVYILSAFILLSIGATHNFSFLPSFSPTIRQSMGMAPPAGLISVTLVIYIFSAVILSLGRMMEGVDKVGGISHLGYLGAFFFFYHFSGDMDAHFWAVFAGGATILALESYQRWNYCRDEILKEREILQELEQLSRTVLNEK